MSVRELSGRPVQIGLPFSIPEPDLKPDPEDRQTAVERRLQRCRSFFDQLGISSSLLRNILLEPDKYWCPVRRENGEKIRVCYSPNKRLRRVHALVGKFFPMDIYTRATAYGRGDSIIKNAKHHRHGKSSLEIDLRDAFESIQTKHIFRMLLRPPSYWGKGLEPDVAWVIARLVTYRGHLRMGAPISPHVFNHAMDRLDDELFHILWPQEEWKAWMRRESVWDEFLLAVGCFRWRAIDLRVWYPPYTYTRYGDNLCFSHSAEAFPQELRTQIIAAVQNHGFVINRRKTREGKRGVLFYPGVVVVHGRLQPTREYVEHFAVHLPKMTPSQKQGHAGFLNQFGPRLYEKLRRRFAVTQSA